VIGHDVAAAESGTTQDRPASERPGYEDERDPDDR
jgi:hypothetical protein